MFARNRNRRPLTWLLLGALMLHASSVAAQEPGSSTVHWAYASFFGTGWYKMDGEQSAFVASFSPELRSGPVTWLGDREREAIYTLRLPFALGVTHLDAGDVPRTLDPANFSMAGIGLSADIDVPLTERFSIRPNAQLSYGTSIGKSGHAFTYRGDIRSRYRFQPDDPGWTAIGAAGIVGFDGNSGKNDSFTFAMLGAEFAHALSRSDSDEGQMLLYWHVAYTEFFNRIKVQTRRGDFTETSNYWQAGFAFGKKGGKFKFWFLRFDRLGLAYDISPSGDLRGINLVIQSLYDP